MEYAGYHFLYTFMFSIIGELIRATKGRTIYIALVFHASMSFAQVFLFSEETGDLFSMKVIALSTTLVGIVFIILSLIIRFIVYKTTNRSLDEVEPNNYLDHMNDDDTTTSNETKSEDHEHNDKKTASLRVNLMKIMLNLNHSLRIKLILQMKNLKRTHLIKKIDVHL